MIVIRFLMGCMTTPMAFSLTWMNKTSTKPAGICDQTPFDWNQNSDDSEVGVSFNINNDTP